MSKISSKFYESAIESGSWDTYMIAVSNQSQEILLAIAHGHDTCADVARVLFRRLDSISSKMSALVSDGVLKNQGGTYSINEDGLQSYCQRKALPVIDQERVLRLLKNTYVRQVGCMWRNAKAMGLTSGNPDDLIDNECDRIEELLKKRWFEGNQ